MGLTYHSSKNKAMTDIYQIEKNKEQLLLALLGNPNTGKSTVFNALTGLHQHTGNWPGKTVVNARGDYSYEGTEHILMDLPGTYSLFPTSIEEEVARDFICFGNSDGILVVSDATCLERNFYLLFQTLELTSQVVLCINLMDEAKKKGIRVDIDGLRSELLIPIVPCAARSGVGIEEIKSTVYQTFKEKGKPHILIEDSNNKSDSLVDCCSIFPTFTICYKPYIEEAVQSLLPLLSTSIEGINLRFVALRLLDGDIKLKDTLLSFIDENHIHEVNAILTTFQEKYELSTVRDDISERIYESIEELLKKYISYDTKKHNRDRIIDEVITSRRFGIPIMLAMLSLLFFITIKAANVPSKILGDLLFGFGDVLSNLFLRLNPPMWLHDVLILGLYKTLAWVVSVMLPPMAIFFPLFTILEDLGYLPRVAFNLDHLFKKACAHGKQCLTMCMGLGCNACGVIACRIIDSKRERLIAILTNNFIPCNGRFPTLITISTIFILLLNGTSTSLSALLVTGCVILGILITLLVSYLLSKTLLKGVPSTFTLELPPYRVPNIHRVLYTSLIDRTIFVLFRAIIIAAPAGALTFIFANIFIGDMSIIGHISSFLDPFARQIGLDGFILMAFIFGLPANEIVLPILLMAYLSTGTLVEYDSIDTLYQVLSSRGWTYLTALNVILFSLLHWPCATTLLTILKETKSKKWTLLAAIIPTAIGIIICFLTTNINRFFQWIF